ncbi:hypothetical protein MSAN_01758300 [Mycena sanguinolenta]|uniref:Uncharacterized protein n=1 Tax=Mycena sanguinolenta TaxID=230812 RepID=A0A8H6XWK7_9AGAR|nr:hypothetical protein MSAN_01758300 [Mycena sanguinolenta]
MRLRRSFFTDGGSSPRTQLLLTPPCAPCVSEIHKIVPLKDTHGNSAFILLYVTLPSLQRLDIADFDITTDVFIIFLTHSTPPLASLRMELPNTIWQAGAIVERFELMPNLTDLELYFTPSEASDVDYIAEPFRPFLEVLGTGTDLIEHLRNLTLWAWFSERGDYEAVISVLAARCASLRSLRLCFPQSTAMRTSLRMFWSHFGSLQRTTCMYTSGPRSTTCCLNA